MAEQREQRNRVKLGTIKMMVTKAGASWGVGSMGSANKIVLLPQRRKNDDGEWESVEGYFEVFLEAKTPDEIQKDKDYWDSRRNNVSDRPAAAAAPKSSAPARKPAGSSAHNREDGDDGVPF